MSVDVAGGTLNLSYLDTTNSALIGQYSMKLIKTIQVPDDRTQATFTEVKVEVPFDVTILAGAPIHVCAADGAWFYVTTGTSAYTTVEGFASPDDDVV